MADFSQPSGSDALEQQNPEGSKFDQAYNQYQEALKQTFENTRAGRLVEAGTSLLEISEWLLGHAAELGKVSKPCGLFPANENTRACSRRSRSAR